MKLPASTMASAYRAGQSAGQNYVDIQRETNKYAMKPAEINKAAYQAQSAEKQVATEINARAKMAENKAEAYTTNSKMNIDHSKKLASINSTNRKAGIVGALGMLGSDMITESKMGDAPKRERADFSVYDKLLADSKAKLDADKAKELATPLNTSTSEPSTSTSTDTAKVNASSIGIKPMTLGAYTGSLDNLSAKDKKDIAYIVSSEAARGTDDEFGVAGVVLNRMKSKNYPTSAYDVGHQKGQFEGVEIGNSRYDKALEDRLFSPTGLQKLESTLKTLDGRQSFKGQALLKNRVAAEDPMFHSRGNFFHYDYQ